MKNEGDMKPIDKQSYASKTYNGKTRDGLIEFLTPKELLRLLTDIVDKVNVLVAAHNKGTKKKAKKK